jgi:hypothetical protein
MFVRFTKNTILFFGRYFQNIKYETKKEKVLFRKCQKIEE